MTSAQNAILASIETVLSERDQFIKDTMQFALRRDDRGAACLLERAEILEFDETLMILEAR